MQIEFFFNNEIDPIYDKYKDIFELLIQKTMRHLAITKDIILETSFVTNDEIQVINRDYRNIDKITDVISFAFQDDVTGEIKIKDLPFINLGSIIISVEKAIEQAENYDHSLDREMSFLFIHGLLHLCGYDHMNIEQETKMISLQDQIIGKRMKQ